MKLLIVEVDILFQICGNIHRVESLLYEDFQAIAPEQYMKQVTTVQCSAVQCSAVQCSAVQCMKLKYITVQNMIHKLH